jgi:hypothetical protein
MTWIKVKSKKNRRSKRRGNNNNSNSNSLITPLTKTVNLQTASGETFVNTTVALFTYNLLNITSPTSSFVSGPSGFTEWMAFYGRYQVIHTHIQLWVTNASDQPLTCVVYPTTVTSLISSTLEASMLPMSRTIEISALTAKTFIKSNFSWSMASLTGRNHNDLSYTGTVDTPPTNFVYLRVVVDATNFTDPVDNVSIKVLVKSKLKLFERAIHFALTAVPAIKQAEEDNDNTNSIIPNKKN